MLLMGLFLFVPIVFEVQLRSPARAGSATPEWVGLANYTRMIGDPVFWQSLGNTLLFTLITVPIELLGGSDWPFFSIRFCRRKASSARSSCCRCDFGVASGMIAVTIFSEGPGIINRHSPRSGRRRSRGSPTARRPSCR